VSAKPDRLIALDGWRALSALIVVAWHLEQYSALPLHGAPGLNGTVGVELFFGISGFVIGRSLLAERAATGQISLAGFYVRRVFRILPPLLLYVSVVVLLTQVGLLEGAARGVVNALVFRCNLIGSACGGYVGGHTWSLSVEEQFYLVIPLLLTLASVLPRAALTAALLALPFVVLGLYLSGQIVVADILSQFMTIGLGVVCALHEDWVRRIVTALPGWTVLPALAAIFLLRGVERAGTRSVIEVLTLSPLVMYVLLGSAFRRTLLSGVLASRPMQTLGAASYSFYLWQQLATYPFRGAGVWFYAASLCACLLIALASYRWLEQPMIRLGAELSGRIQRRRIPLPAGAAV
jgi:peptidoglycan/LPS O-acetylase OafA/YrhL